MAKEFKTLKFPNTLEGQKREKEAFNLAAKDGWVIAFEGITPEEFRWKRAVCLTFIFPPLAFFAGKTKGTIKLTMMREIPDKQSITPAINESQEEVGRHKKVSMPYSYSPVVGIETEALIKRAKLFIEDNEFDEADRYLEQALNQDPENSSVHLSKLMVKFKVHNVEELKNLPILLDGEKLFERALRFADVNEKARLYELAYTNRLQIEQKRVMARANEEAQYELQYKEALDMKAQLDEKGGNITDIMNLIALLERIRPYKDTQVLIDEARILLKKTKRQTNLKIFIIVIAIFVIVIAWYFAKEMRKQKTKLSIPNQSGRSEHIKIEHSRFKMTNTVYFSVIGRRHHAILG